MDSSIVQHKSTTTADYSRWMVGDDCAGARRELASELVNAITGNDFNVNTLEQTLRLLDHDNLCLTLWSSSQRPLLGNEGIVALQRPFVESLLLKTSQRLINSVTTSSCLEQELQSRIILSSISLLHTHGVREVEANFFDSIQKQVQERYKDLKWQRTPSKSFSAEVFRRFQCSYLLCSCAAYTGTKLVRSEPLAVVVLTRVIAAVSVAFDVASAATGGNLPSLKGTIGQINSIVQPLQSSVGERYATLFTFQELARLTVALHTFLMVSRREEEEEREQHLSNVLTWSEQIALASLDKVMSIIDDDLSSRMETQSPPTPVREFFLAFTGRGPPPLKLYFFLYGLLDCAAMLCRIIPNDALKAEFKTGMRKILKQGIEPSFRWKAIEILLADPSTRFRESQNITSISSESTMDLSHLKEEVRVVAQCLYYEENNSSDALLDHGLTDPQTLQLPSYNGKSVALQPDDWKESDLSPAPLSEVAEWFRVKIGTRACYSAGLAPDGTIAFYLSSNSILLHWLPPVGPDRPAHTAIKKDQLGKSSLTKAALSDHFLALLTTEALAIYNYRSASFGKDDPLIKVPLISDFGQANFGPDSVAIHESSTEVCIAIGGGEGRDNSLRAGFCIYQTDYHGREMIPRKPKFCSSPDPLHTGFVKAIGFSPDGIRVVCVTNSNVLIWTRQQIEEENQPPFCVFRKPTEELDNCGLTSATVFHTQSPRPYVFCTVDSSSERYKNGGEWSFISPVGFGPIVVPSILESNLSQFQNSGGILSGAVSSDGDLVAFLEESGKIVILPLKSNVNGGLSADGSPTILSCSLNDLAQRKKVSSTCLRFCRNQQGEFLIAVDVKGNVVRKRIGATPTHHRVSFSSEARSPLSPHGSRTSIEPPSSTTSNSADSHVQPRKSSFSIPSAFIRRRKKSLVT